MKRKTITTVLILLWFWSFFINAGLVSALQISITDTLQEDLSLQENITLNVQNYTNFELTLPDQATRITVNGIATNNTVTVDCSNCERIITFTLKDAYTKLKKDYYSYSRTLQMPEPDVLIYKVRLPYGHIIGAENKEIPIVPSPTGIETDGEHIIISWEEYKPTLPKRYLVLFNGHEAQEQSLLEFKGELSEWPVWLLTVACLLAGIAIGWLLANKQKVRIEHIPQTMFTPDEKAVLQALKEGTSSQKEMGKVLNWSKSKVSAVITGLEFKKIVSREKHGRQYTVYLKKSVDESVDEKINK